MCSCSMACVTEPQSHMIVTSRVKSCCKKYSVAKVIV